MLFLRGGGGVCVVLVSCFGCFFLFFARCLGVFWVWLSFFCDLCVSCQLLDVFSMFFFGILRLSAPLKPPNNIDSILKVFSKH